MDGRAKEAQPTLNEADSLGLLAWTRISWPPGC